MAADVLSRAVDSLRVGTVALREMHFAQTWTLSLEGFAGIGFHVVTRGACRLELEDGLAFSLSAGDIVVLPHGSAHTLMSEATACDVDVEIMCGAYRLSLEGPLRILDVVPNCFVVDASTEQHGQLLGTLDMLRADIDGAAPGVEAARRALLDLLVVQLLRTWAQDEHEWLGSERRDKEVSRVLASLDKQPEYAWTATGMAREVGLSRSTFTRRFTAQVGGPPMTYLTRNRMTLACELLRATDAPLAVVATHVGYSSEYTFAAAFKREMGLSPGRYRH